jgi:uncharacterized membrane protein (UPF0127 family)
MKKNFVSFTFALIFLIVGLFLTNHSSKILRPENIKYVEIAGQNIKVDLALNTQTQEQGLSGRQSLNENEGMLFVFSKPDRYLFWMKDMNFPIDMIWVGEDTKDLRVIYIKKNALPSSYPETFGPSVSMENAKYVLEVVAGFADKNNLKVGDRVVLK